VTIKQKSVAANIDEYIAACHPSVHKKLDEIRQVIKNAAPGAEEKISYGMPAFALNGILVYFAVYKNHIGFYPTPSGIHAFKKELAGMAFSKGAVRFPLDKPVPLDLITKIVIYRVKENLNKEAISRSET